MFVINPAPTENFLPQRDSSFINQNSNTKNNERAITNPAAYYLKGADFKNVIFYKNLINAMYFLD